MNRFETRMLTAGFLLMITIPVIAFVAGLRPEPNQNRPPTPLPDFTVSEMLNRELTPQIDAYLQDALIIAPGAVAAQAWTDVALGESPSEKVTLGSNGWLYYTLSVAQPCLSDADIGNFVDTINRAERAIAATDRQLLVAVAPDKASIIPDFLSPEESHCVVESADRLESIADADSLLTIFTSMRKARADIRPVYYRMDTHWTASGAAVMAEALVNTIEPGGWIEDATQVIGSTDHEGDLTVLIGLPSSETVDQLRTVLPETVLSRETRNPVSPAGNEIEALTVLDYTIAGQPTIEGKTVVLHDSFGWSMIPTIAPYFETATFVDETRPAKGFMQTELESADTIIFMPVQRSIRDVIFKPDLAAQFVSAFADEFASTEEGTRGTDDLLEVSASEQDTYIVVEMAAGTETAEVGYNDVTAKLDPDNPRAAYYVGSGGTMTFVGAVDYRVVSITQ